MKSLGFVVLLAACSFQSSPAGQAPVDGAGLGNGSDAGPGSGSDAANTAPPDARQCFGVGVVNVCLKAAPTGDKQFPTTTLDTSNDASCTEKIGQANGPELCVVAASTITVTGTLTAIGTRPLVLIAATTLNIQAAGAIDASSKVNGGARKGAGANTGTCSTLVHGKNDSGGGGGGAGGSFGSLGGHGGTGDQNNTGQPTGVAPGAAVGTTQIPTSLRGGCPGSAGGDGNDSDVTKFGGQGGDGGGAVYLIAGTGITLAGNVFASGAGGSTRSNGAGKEEGGGGAALVA